MVYQALIEYKGTQAVVDLPDDKYIIGRTLKTLGCPPRTPMFLRDEEDEDLHIKLISGTDFGGKLSLLLNEKNTLLEANALAAAIEKTHPAVRAQLEAAVTDMKYGSLEELYRDRTDLLRSYGRVRETLYFPLTAVIDPHGEDEEMSPVGDRMIALHENEIRDALCQEQSPEFGDMADYFDGTPAAQAKLVSAFWDVEPKNGILYGKVDLYLTGMLTVKEKFELLDWITGQNSDGLGEGFEQRPVHTEDGDLYVSMYDGTNPWICYADDLDDCISQLSGPVMGGM